MALLDRIREATAHRLDDLTPLWVAGERCGHVRPDLAARLRRGPGPIGRGPGGLWIDPALGDAPARTAALEPLLRRLSAEGALGAWWGERVPVRPCWGAPDWFHCDRAAQDPLGLPAYGVHLNAYVAGPGGPRLWVARRAATRRAWPGRLDHLVAGGQPVGLSRGENLRKEAAEEAGLRPALLAGLRPATALGYRLRTPEGLSDDTLFVYDVALPPDFEPVNRDGEVEAFACLPIPEVLARLAAGPAFKPNVALVVLDFLVRHDLLPAAAPEGGAVRAALAPLRRPVDAAPR